MSVECRLSVLKFLEDEEQEALMEYTDSDKKLVWICLQCLKYTKFGQFIFKGIIKIIVTRRQF